MIKQYKQIKALDPISENCSLYVAIKLDDSEKKYLMYEIE
jgi:hypothetical protein